MGEPASRISSVVVSAAEASSRKPSANTTPNENTRLRSQPSTPRRASLAWKIRLSVVCSRANTAVAPTNSSSVLHRPASEPTSGREVALRSTVSATARASLPASSPICAISSACAEGYSDAVIHSSSTSSGASEIRV